MHKGVYWQKRSNVIIPFRQIRYTGGVGWGGVAWCGVWVGGRGVPLISVVGELSLKNVYL